MKFPAPATENRFEIVAPASLSLNQPAPSTSLFSISLVPVSMRSAKPAKGRPAISPQEDEARHFVIGKDGEPERLTASFLSQDKRQPHCPA